MTEDTLISKKPDIGEPCFLQGVYPFMGEGLIKASLLSPELVYTIPKGKIAKLAYFRAGNASDQLIYLSVMKNGVPMRYFPIAPQGDSHVALAIQEEIPEETRLEIHLAAAEGVFGTVILDVGFVEWKQR